MSSVLHDSLEIVVSLHLLNIISQHFVTEDIVILRERESAIEGSMYRKIRTVLGTTPGLCMRADLMAWKTSTVPSVFRRSN